MSQFNSEAEFEERNDIIKDKGDELVFKGSTINLIRTTQRNYIDLTNIADNKANILISINSLMLTVLIPIVFSNYDFIMKYKLFIPIILLSVTFLTTIVCASLVITPFSINRRFKKQTESKTEMKSPFFFQNYADKSFDEYIQQLKDSTKQKHIVSRVLAYDLYEFGLNLSSKYKMIRLTYKLFYTGMIISFAILILRLAFI